MGVGVPVSSADMAKKKRPPKPPPPVPETPADSPTDPPDESPYGPLAPKVTIKGFTITVTLEPMWKDRQPKNGGNRRLLPRNGTADVKGAIADDYIWKPKPPKD